MVNQMNLKFRNELYMRKRKLTMIICRNIFWTLSYFVWDSTRDI